MSTGARTSIARAAAHSVLCVLLLSALFALSAPFARADSGGLSVTVTPPLIQLSIGPGESWTSVLKVVNNNDYDVTYYTQVVDMQADGEEGRSKFIPLINEPQDAAYQSFALARWIQLSPDPILIRAGETGSIPFTVTIPQNAEPGGHYAAILVGTQPGSFNQPNNLMKVSSFVSSLIFVNIKGDVVESGRIREFSTAKSLYQTPSVDFTVRFENTGNTHVHPQGSVTIYNMWGKERGQVLINDKDSSFGNVLPESIRRFQFSWSGEQSVFDIGPYRAVVTLNYGDQGKQSVSATTYFWVVPLVPVSIGLGSIIVFLILLTWLIRRYVRRALMLEKARFGIPSSAPLAQVPMPIIEALIEPLREGVIDLRSVRGSVAPQAIAAEQAVGDVSRRTMSAESPITGQVVQTTQRDTLSLYELIAKYRLFIVFLILVVAMIVGGWWYFAKVLQSQRAYQISNVTTQSEATSTKR